MVLHGIALHLMILHSLACHCIVSYGVAWYCIVGFGARAVSRKTPTYFILFKFCPDGTTNVMLFCLPANVYIEFICIIAGTLSMFSARGCVPDIRPRECTGKYCP